MQPPQRGARARCCHPALPPPLAGSPVPLLGLRPPLQRQRLYQQHLLQRHLLQHLLWHLQQHWQRHLLQRRC